MVPGMLFRRRHKRIASPEVLPDEGTPIAPYDAPVTAPIEESAPEDWREPDAMPSPEERGAETSEAGEADEHPHRRKRGIRIGQFFTGGVLSQEEFTHRLPVIVYIVLLMLLYIANGFRIQHKHSELDRIADEIKQLKTEAVTASAVRMTLTRQSEIEQLLREQNIPLSERTEPLRVIEE